MLSAYIYQPLYLHIVMILSLFAYHRISQESKYSVVCSYNNINYAFFWGIFFVFFLAFRPITAKYGLGDTYTYGLQYEYFRTGRLSLDSFEKELWFNGLMFYCSSIMNVNFFFLTVLLGYIGFMLWGCNRIFGNTTYLAFLFCIGAFSFFPYAVNGIRNGLATSVIILAVSFLQKNDRKYLLALSLLICAFNIHTTSLLPIIAIIICLLYSNVKFYLFFWGMSIFLSFSIGNYIEALFLNLGFDDRLDTYLTSEEFNDSFSSVGFRWDFLCYSVIPIILGWYCVIKRKFMDSNYLLLLNTYIICNAFWVILIRASFSNRFAYLSWFLYPILLAYPLLKFPLWRHQGQKTGLILIGHTLFTYVMWIIK